MITTAKFVAAAILALAALSPALPASAGERENAYMRTLAGSYVGAGQFRAGRVRTDLGCTLSLTPSSNRLKFSTICAGSDGLSGNIAYDDSIRRYVVTSGGKTIRARKSGDSLSFVIEDKTRRGTGKSSFTLNAGRATLKLEVRAVDGSRGSGTVNFRRR